MYTLLCTPSAVYSCDIFFSGNIYIYAKLQFWMEKAVIIKKHFKTHISIYSTQLTILNYAVAQ